MSVTDRVTLVLKARPGETLTDLKPFIRLGSTVMIARSGALISGVSDEDLQMVLGRERDERQAQAELWDRARLAPPQLAAHAQEMFDLLRRIDVKCGGLDAALSHGMEPSEQMWQESREAKEAIWDLLDKIASDGAAIDAARVNQTSETAKAVNQTTQISGSLITENPVVTESINIDDHVKLARDAARYRHLRDRECIEDASTDLLVMAGDTYFTGTELDKQVDDAIRLTALLERHGEPA